MKIAIITHCIFPQQSPRSFRSTELAKYFASQGHEVHIFASLGKYDYSTFEHNYHIHVHSLGHMRFETLNSDNYVRDNFLDKVGRRLLGRVLEFPLIELAWKTKTAIEKIRDVDLLITIAYPFPIHWGAAWAKKKMKKGFPKVWISDCGDPYMGNTVGLRHPWYFRYVEEFWGEKTDYVTIPIEESRECYYDNVQNKIRIIPQGFDFQSVNIDKNFRGNTIPRFAYAGIVYEGYRDPTKFLNYLASLEDISFEFVVYTRNIAFFEKFKPLLGEKLKINNFVPREQLLYELSQMDFLINLKNKSAVQSPSKLIDYYLTKRPILEITSDFNEQNYVDEFLEGNYDNQMESRDISMYDIRNVGEQFLTLYRDHNLL